MQGLKIGLFGRQAEVEVRKQLAEARARGEDLQEEAAQLVTRLQAAVEDGDAAKSKLVGERDNSATLERARSSAVEVPTQLRGACCVAYSCHPCVPTSFLGQHAWDLRSKHA